jgi:hypothetical protein
VYNLNQTPSLGYLESEIGHVLKHSHSSVSATFEGSQLASVLSHPPDQQVLL